MLDEKSKAKAVYTIFYFSGNAGVNRQMMYKGAHICLDIYFY